MGNWKLNFKNWRNMSIDTALLLLNESKEYLDYTINLSDKLTQRGYTILMILLAIIGGLTNKLLSFNLDSSLNQVIFTLVFCSLIFSIGLGIYLLKLIFPFDMKQRGRIPKELSNEEYLIPSNLNQELAYLSFVLNEIQNIQSKIEYNVNMNSKRLKVFKSLLISLLIFFAIFITIYSLIIIVYQ